MENAEFIPLALAGVSFVAAHLLPSSLALRPRLVRILGENGYLAAYTLFALATFGWLCHAYVQAPHTVMLWNPGVLRFLPLLLMPVALWFIVCGVSGPNPSSVRQEQKLAEAEVAEREHGVELRALAVLAARVVLCGRRQQRQCNDTDPQRRRQPCRGAHPQRFRHTKIPLGTELPPATQTHICAMWKLCREAKPECKRPMLRRRLARRAGRHPVGPDDGTATAGWRPQTALPLRLPRTG